GRLVLDDLQAARLGPCLDKGQPLFAYTLRDNSYRISLRSGQGGKLPLAYVKVSSELLAHKPLEAVAEELAEVIGRLGESDGVAMVSRIDLYADFQTDTDIGAIPREAWITQGKGIDAYSRGGKFTGWVFGAGATLSARLYDKTIEIEKSHKTYFHELWKRSGWDGDSTVWRLEFQFRREALGSFRVSRLDRVQEKLWGLWLHAVIIWLRLAIPDPQDSNRGRWPIHPVWEYLGQIRWRLDDEPLTRSYTPARVPSLDRLYRMFIGLLTSYMAVRGLRVYGEGCIRLMEDCRANLETWCREKLEIEFSDWLDQKLALKVRQFNTRHNVRTVRQDAKTSDKVEKNASDYYDKSRGE
ncbi:MAG: replication initiation factor, partial [Chloroflexota bacterium]